MNTVKDICSLIENLAPLSYQENYDNCGLLTGNIDDVVSGILVCLDVTEDIVEEAMQLKCNMIVAHHPLIFTGLKKLTGTNYVERTVIKALQNNISIYAAHTNLDNVFKGVNSKIAEKIGLQNCSILLPKKGLLKKLVTFCPEEHAPAVRKALFEAGAGEIGNYNECSFNVSGTGTFKANEHAKPFVGEAHIQHSEKEQRIEVLFESYKEAALMNELFSTHPYEEVAHYITILTNNNQWVGSGMMGELVIPEEEIEFLKRIKSIFGSKCIKHTQLLNKKVKKVAICGGSGIFLLGDAIKKGADVFITADVKYHGFFDTENRILLADIGHYESEQYTMELFYEIITKKFSTFAVHLTKINTNPINYI